MSGEQKLNRPLLEKGTEIDEFKVIRLLGRGGYSDTYMVKEKESDNFYAMKTERLDSEKHNLKREIKLFKFIGTSILLPKFIKSGENEEMLYMVIELLGPSLSLVKNILPDRRYEPYTVLKLAYEMLRCIQEFHRHGFVHKDIKPENFLIRNNESNPLVIIDFGVSKRLYGSKDQHIEFSENRGYFGTLNYSSPNAYKRYELSRRDDMYSWFYSVFDISRGYLPWPGKSNPELTQEIKLEMTPEELCKDLHPVFLDIYKHIISLKFKEKPHYKLIRDSLLNAMKEFEPKPEKFEWIAIPEDRIRGISAISLNPNKKKVYTNFHSHKKKKHEKKNEDCTI